MKLVVVESPFAPSNGRTVEENIDYARACMADCIRRGEAPIASHLLYTQPGILDDTVPDERARGIEAGLLWARHGEMSVFYTDHGWSSGMKAALSRAVSEGRPVVERNLSGDGA